MHGSLALLSDSEGQWDLQLPSDKRNYLSLRPLAGRTQAALRHGSEKPARG